MNKQTFEDGITSIEYSVESVEEREGNCKGKVISHNDSEGRDSRRIRLKGEKWLEMKDFIYFSVAIQWGRAEGGDNS